MYNKEQVRANVPHDLVASINGTDTGPLKGLTFMVKDLFEVKGHKTGNGSPDFLKHNKESTKTAPLVQKLLDSGASLTGMTICDEFFYSLTGINAHYGSPLNVRATGRMAGGSSSGLPQVWQLHCVIFPLEVIPVVLLECLLLFVDYLVFGQLMVRLN